MKGLGEFLGGVLWIVGIIIAKGFWQTFFSVLIFPYAWYIAIKHFMVIAGLA